MKPLHGHGGAAVFKITRAGPEFRLAVRSFRGELSRAMGRPALSAAVAEGDKRIILVDGVAAAARSTGFRPTTTSAPIWCAAAPPQRRSFTRARTRNLRDHRPRAQTARPAFRRHRRDRRLSDRDQRDLADGHQGDQKTRRPRSRRRDLGRDRGRDYDKLVSCRGDLDKVHVGRSVASANGQSDPCAEIETAPRLDPRHGARRIATARAIDARSRRLAHDGKAAGSVEFAQGSGRALFAGAWTRRGKLARRAFLADGGGLACAGRFAHIEDELIREIFDYVTTYVHPPGSGRAGDAFVIAAVGGYGRGDACARFGHRSAVSAVSTTRAARRDASSRPSFICFGISARKSAMRRARSRNA